MPEIPWYDVKLAIALCNNQDTILSEFFWNFLSIAKPNNHVVLRGRSRLKAVSLNRLVEEAWRWKVQKILFLDIDQTFPVETIPRLLSRNLPIVSGLTYTTEYPYSPAAGWFKEEDGELIATNQSGSIWKVDYNQFPDNENHLVRVDWTGISCLLVDMEVFNNIYFPCFKEIWDDEIGDRVTGHDVNFCKAVKKAGYEVYVDTTVQCGHFVQLNVNDVYVKAYHASNIHEKEYELVKTMAQESAYWDEQYFRERLNNVKRVYSVEWEEMLRHVPENASVAEVGCGMGHLMGIMKEKGMSPYGYDFSATAIENIHKKGLEGEIADLRTLKPNGRLFDCVIGSHVLEHMEDDTGFLKTCSSLLKDKSGKVVMSVPFQDNHPISLMEHSHNYDEESLASVMKQVFNNVEIITVSKEMFGKEVKPGLIAVGSNGI